jgi:voltage-gated sodium channel
MLFILCYVFGIFMTVTVGQNDELYDNYFVVGPCGDICNDGSPTECSDCKRAYQHQEPFDHEVYFKTVMMSVFTLLQVLTLDGWSEGIARHVLHEQGWQIVFFVIFIALGSFGLLNIIIGVVVENTLSTSEKDNNFVRKRKERDRQNVLSQLREIFEYADADGSGTLTIDEVKNALDKPEVHTNLKKIEFPVENPERIFDLLDYSNAKELSIDEFITGCMRHEGEAKSKDLLAAQVALDTMRRHYDSLQEEMDMFNEKLRLLETTAESLIDHGEHVFLNAQEYRMRHPTMKENQPVQLSDHRLNTAPWERKIEVEAPPPVPSGWEVARRSDGTLDYLQLQMLQDRKRQAEDSAMAISDYEHDGPEELQDSFDNSNRSPNLALQDIPGAITDIGPEAGAIVVKRN